MLKVTFKEPKLFIQHGLMQECMFLFCYKAVKSRYHHTFIFDNGETDYIRTKHIKSIEHVKPTHL